MRRPHGIIFALALLVACSNRKEVEHAKHSLYDTDFAVVYNASLEAVRNLYPNLDDAPGNGAIRTAWHQVQYANTQDDLTNQSVVAAGQGMGTGGVNNVNNSPASNAAGMPTRLAYKRFFIRFDVTVMGGRPWRVKVVGHAAEWEPGAAMPVELHGIARPPWLEPRTEALQLAIYKKVRKFAIPAKDEPKALDEGPELPKTDPGSFRDVPPLAAKALAKLKDALASRDYGTVRAGLADDVVWSLGGGTGADAAMATWQADPESLAAMSRAIAGGCGGDAKQVACPPGPPVVGAFQLVIESRGDAWRVTSFVKAE